MINASVAVIGYKESAKKRLALMLIENEEILLNWSRYTPMLEAAAIKILATAKAYLEDQSENDRNKTDDKSDDKQGK